MHDACECCRKKAPLLMHDPCVVPRISSSCHKTRTVHIICILSEDMHVFTWEKVHLHVAVFANLCCYSYVAHRNSRGSVFYGSNTSFIYVILSAATSSLLSSSSGLRVYAVLFQALRSIF